ncbi:hypothetical protein BDA96_02G193500 [Sorghum bicolor]|uniref:DUF4408 domain-containing protein n=1 Tax=Sorghum bicolor TaxID=4558 RepID=A0A921RPD7_SORBI|nr:hypothetical protein BDA96_02G193500 [Sorghum bicolor]
MHAKFQRNNNDKEVMKYICRGRAQPAARGSRIIVSYRLRLLSMTTAWWWFVAMNAVIVAIAVLSSSSGRPSLVPTPRRHRSSGITRRASSASAVLQSLLSFSLFSFPSACLSSSSYHLQPDAPAAAATTDQETTETEEELVERSSPPIKPQLTSDEEEEEEEDPNAMSMDEAYALVLASQERPEREKEEEARRSEVDAKAEEFIRCFKEDLRHQQRLNSIANYTQMLRRRAPACGRRRPCICPQDR